MRKFQFVILCMGLMVIMTSCSNADKTTSSTEITTTTVTTTTASSVSVSEETAVSADVSSYDESKAEEIGCVAYMDTTDLHDGVTVSDPEFIGKATDFKDYVLANGTKFSARPNNVPKGSYLNIKLDEENSIHIASSDMTWACINDEYYEIGNEEIKEFYDYANAYLKSLQ